MTVPQSLPFFSRRKLYSFKWVYQRFVSIFSNFSDVRLDLSQSGRVPVQLRRDRALLHNRQEASGRPQPLHAELQRKFGLQIFFSFCRLSDTKQNMK